MFNAPTVYTDPSGDIVWFIVVGFVAIGGILVTPTPLGPTPTPPPDPAPEPVGLDDFPVLNDQRTLFGRGSFSREQRKIVLGESTVYW